MEEAIKELRQTVSRSGLRRWLSGKDLPANAGDTGDEGSINPWGGKVTWRRSGNPLQYSCLEDPMDKGSWWATVHRITEELDMT